MKLYILIGLITINCLAQKKEIVSIEIINSSLRYYDFTKLDSNPKHSDTYNFKLKDSILDFPKNIITYKITNSTKYKYFFVLNDDFFADDTIKDISLKATYRITNDRNKVIRPKIVICDECFTGLFDPVIKDYEFIVDSIAVKITENKNFKNAHKFNEIKKYGFMLYPNETKTLKTVLYLPFSSKDRDNFKYWEYFYTNVNFKDSFYFQLFFKNNINFINSYLPNEVYEELNKNKIKIYNKPILSNKVPIKFE
jgi:hypothetical protein